MCAWPTVSTRSKNWSTEILTDADLEAQLDLLHSYFNDSLNGSSGHGHTGSTNDGKKIVLTTAVSGLLPAANGGTAADLSASAAGAVPYFASTGVMSSLPIGTAYQQATVNSGATAIAWASSNSIQVVNATTRGSSSITANIPYDDTIPQNTEGTQVLSQAITPKTATNLLRIDVVVHLGCSSANVQAIAALFQDTTADALAVGTEESILTSGMVSLKFTHWMTSGTTSSTTFKVRAAANSGNSTFNGGGGSQKFNGSPASTITITEYVV